VLFFILCALLLLISFCAVQTANFTVARSFSFSNYVLCQYRLLSFSENVAAKLYPYHAHIYYKVFGLHWADARSDLIDYANKVSGKERPQIPKLVF
jgi:hypothetical protein